MPILLHLFLIQSFTYIDLWVFIFHVHMCSLKVLPHSQKSDNVLHLHFLAQPYISQFPMEPWFLLWRVALETKVWVVDVFQLPGLLSSTRKYGGIVSRAHTSAPIAPSVYISLWISTLHLVCTQLNILRCLTLTLYHMDHSSLLPVYLCPPTPTAAIHLLNCSVPV